ncbi:hypothetical protein CGCF415_v005721 [Colletotrichum fructicola]|nr:hypothetical protein CGCF415_v005721 [Colletotrichum fructicola]KAF4937119.1 hypothetical protein CGCF245_v005923 [Colletotrichum fructicola]
MPSRMLAAMFRGTTDKQKGGRRSSDRTSTALWQPKIKPKIKPKKDKQDGLHLACPYTKCDDATQEQLFRCRAKAFPDTHRLKQHLYSVHRQKPHCTRCGEIFASNVGLEAHSRLTEGCNLSQKICIEGFNSTQEEQLRSKKRQPNLRTEEDKWRNIFRILFPDCSNIPDPYYRTTSGRSINLKDVESIFADTVPRELEERLFSKLEAISGSLDDDQRREVKSILKDFTSQRVRQITEKTGSTCRDVMDTAETIERDGQNSGCLPTDVDSQEESPEDTRIGLATPNEPVGNVPLGLELNPVHTDVPSQERPSGVLSESENDTLERTWAAWNEDMVEVSSYGWAIHDGLDRPGRRAFFGASRNSHDSRKRKVHTTY